MADTLRPSAASGKYDLAGGPYRGEGPPRYVRHVRALSTAMWGHAAAVARVTGISERILQHYMAPHSEKEGPFERGARIIRALRELGAPNWLDPVRELADECGCDLAPRAKAEPAAADPDRLSVTCMAEVVDVLREVHESGRDGVRTRDEVERIEREAHEAIELIHQIVAESRASAARPLRGVR